MTAHGSSFVDDATPARHDDERAAAVRALEEELGQLFLQARHVIAANAQRLSPGMLPGTYKVFTTIVRHGPLTLSAVADALMSDKGQTSRAVRDLEDLGLISRTPDPDDRRSSLIAATPDGLDRLSAARSPNEDALLGTLSEWPIDDVRELTRLLHALTSGKFGRQPQ